MIGDIKRDTKRCANQSAEGGGERCKQDRTPGHIYCDPCRIANGGYSRYTPKRHKA
jgi:hypothetical protein